MGQAHPYPREFPFIVSTCFERMNRNILVVDYRVPAPDQDSGSASTLAYLRILAGAGYKLTFIPSLATSHKRYAEDLKRLGIEVPGLPEGGRLEEAVEAHAPGADAVLLYRGPVASRVFGIVRRVAPKAKIVFHPVDLHFVRMSRQAELTGDGELKAEALQMREVELTLVESADAAIVVSTAEQGLLRELLPGVSVHQIPIMRAIPQKRRFPGFENRRDIAFVGAFLHKPNPDGITWFVREVWPKLLAKGYADRLVIAGAFLSSEIAELAAEKIIVRGHVPDLVTFLDGFRISLAPLRFGAGVKGKIVSSLSLGLPVTATDIAAEGMGLQDGHDVLMAQDAEGMAAQIVKLYSSRNLWEKLAANGYRTFVDRYSEEAGRARLLAVFEELLSGESESAPVLVR